MGVGFRELVSPETGERKLRCAEGLKASHFWLGSKFKRFIRRLNSGKFQGVSGAQKIFIGVSADAIRSVFQPRQTYVII